MNKLLIGLITITLYSASYALEFGQMGNTSAGMGGAGVALKNSAWGLYYNPALLSTDPKVKFGYSVGVDIKENNLAKIAQIDVKNMSNTAERLIQTFTNGGGTTPTAGQITTIIESALKTSLNDSNPTGNVSQDLQTYLGKHPDGDYSDLITNVLTEVQKNTALTQEQKVLLGNIAGNIDYQNLKFNGNGTTGTNSVSELLTNITIKKGGDKGLDKAVADISTIQDILKDNNLSMVSQNGLVLQISNNTMNETLGSFGVAYFASLYSNLSIKADASKMRLIIQGGNGYYELKDNGDSYSYMQSNKDDYEKHSLIASLEVGSEAHKLIATGFLLSEIPIGYARTFYLKAGNINLGVSGKLMNAFSTQNTININKNLNFTKEINSFASLNNAVSSNNIGIDLGVLYELDLPKFRYLTLGLVAKNINSPSFKSTLENIQIKPQYRMGIGYNSKFLTFAFDADLSPNDLITFSNIKQQSQMIGGGIAFDFKITDLRVGLMKDLRQDTGLILTAGFNILGLFDLSLQSSTNFTNVQGAPIPQYFSIRLGGGFSF